MHIWLLSIAAAASNGTAAPPLYPSQFELSARPLDAQTMPRSADRSRSRFDAEGRECLRNRTTGRRVCHTRAEWVEIAQRIDRKQR